jgi:membrane protein implicated in regulation of membrane protease activity
MMAGAAFWHWWTLGGLLVIVEAFAPGFMFLWFGAAAGLVGLILVLWPELGLTIQLLIYAGLLMLCAFGWRWLQRVRPVGTDQPELNRRAAQYVGRRFRLVAPIVDGRGRIEVGDGSWPVAGPELPAGQIVEVAGVEGAVLQVRPALPKRGSHAASDRHGEATPA